MTESWIQPAVVTGFRPVDERYVAVTVSKPELRELIRANQAELGKRNLEHPGDLSAFVEMWSRTNDLIELYASMK